MQLLLGTNNFCQPVLSSTWKIIWKTQTEKCAYIIFTLTIFRRIIYIIFDSVYLAEFPEEQLKELKGTKFIALLKEVGKVEVLSLT